MNMFNLFLIVLILLKDVFGTNIIYPGDSDFCTEKLGEESRCIEIKKCPIAKNLIRQGKTPLSCGFSGNIPFVCCATSSFSELNVTGFKPDNRNNRNNCGINNVEERGNQGGNEGILFPINSTSIYGDSVIQPRDLKKTSENWPWTVSVIRKNDSVRVCSGFLIDELRVISAAHCYINDGNAENYNVFVLKNGRETLYDVTELRIHQDFFGYYQDVAELKIYPEIFDVVPVCLPIDIPENSLVGKNAIILSWLDDGYDGVVSHDMKIIEMQICDQVYSELTDNPFPFGVKDGFICAFPVDLTTDICKVDTGGLLMIKEEEKWSIIGIGTLRIPCDRPTYPAVYTNIYYYLNWLNQ